MANTKLTTTSNQVKVSVSDESTKITTSSNKINVDVKTTKLSVSLARVGPQGATPRITLSEVIDVDTSGASEGDGLILNASNTWVPHTFTTTSLSDIDNTNKQDGSILIYKNTSQKYTATNSIEDNMTISGGTF